MATKNAVVMSDYSEDNDGPFREIDASGDEVVAAPTIKLNVYTVETQPEGVEGELAYFSDGDGGSPCLGVYTEESIWRRVVLGDEIASE